jgi:D-tyrosyl-tRNA(Tyr) deacylase
MRVVVQRVSEAQVSIDGRTAGAIGRGLLVFLGIACEDTPDDAAWLARKVAGLRVFPDEAGRMNRDVREAGSGLLAVSQFTLLASTRKGTRPSFNDAAPPDLAVPLYERFLHECETLLGAPVARGEFGGAMQVALVNDGPVTLVIDSRLRE